MVGGLRPPAPEGPGAEASGVLAIDKPVGWTSHDVVAVARALTRVRRVGHGGTLDPLASGLLPILVGHATKFAERLHEATKVYDAIVRFGSETTTDDREGTPTRTADPPDDARLEGALVGLRGVTLQVPPAYAALKVKGRPAYARARAGEVLDLPARTVQVLRLDVIATAPPDVRLLVVCSSGTYVRSLARDLGRALGSAAHLAGLRRLAVGSLESRGAIRADALREQGRDAILARLREANDDLLRLDPRFLADRAATIVSGEGAD
jgi:tRNA pseudouridine55 synthase